MSESSDYSKMWDFYQNQSCHYFTGARGRLEKLARIVKSFPDSKNAKVLDIGFGEGTLLSLLNDSGLQSYGIDFAKENVELTQKKFNDAQKHIEVRYGDIGDIPFPDNFFDTVIATETIEHLNNQTLVHGLREIHRILKTNGNLVITVPYREKLEDDLTVCPECHTKFHRWGHQQSFDESKLRTLLQDAQFQHINIRGVIFDNYAANMWGKAEKILKNMLGKYKNFLVIASK